jgi:squalene-hopene/tetraprenyl-beta-curcumene cyclase
MINDILEQRTSAAKQPDAARVNIDTLEQQIQKSAQALLAQQRPDGHWVFELEADATIPAEYVLLRHYLGEPVDAELERKIAVYLRRIQGDHGGWPLFRDGALDISARARRCLRAAAPSAPTCSPASCSRCSVSSPGAPCR